MNTERAIKLINDLIDVYVTGREAETALKMAIEALRAQQERERFKDCHIWEIGDTLKTICDKCEVLIKASDIRVLMQQEQENPKPLSLEELKERVGKPVWIIEGNQNHPAECEIYCVEIYRCDSRYVYFFYFGCATEEGLLIEHYGKTWLAYDHKPKEA
jgi:hypothetical protein